MFLYSNSVSDRFRYGFRAMYRITNRDETIRPNNIRYVEVTLTRKGCDLCNVLSFTVHSLFCFRCLRGYEVQRDFDCFTGINQSQPLFSRYFVLFWIVVIQPRKNHIIRISSFRFVLDKSTMQINGCSVSCPVNLLNRSMVISLELLICIIVISFIQFSTMQNYRLSEYLIGYELRFHA